MPKSFKCDKYNRAALDDKAALFTVQFYENDGHSSTFVNHKDEILGTLSAASGAQQHLITESYIFQFLN